MAECGSWPRKAVRPKAGKDDAVFVIGSAAPPPFELQLGHYSVHTNPEALLSGEIKIAEIGRRLREQNKAEVRSGALPIFK